MTSNKAFERTVDERVCRVAHYSAAQRERYTAEKVYGWLKNI